MHLHTFSIPHLILKFAIISFAACHNLLPNLPPNNDLLPNQPSNNNLLPNQPSNNNLLSNLPLNNNFLPNLPSNNNFLPNPCLQITTCLHAFITCQSSFHLRPNTISSLHTYTNLLPDESYTRMITHLLHTPCSSSSSNAFRTRSLVLHVIEEEAGTFCVGVERWIRGGMFVKGWAMLATKSTMSTKSTESAEVAGRLFGRTDETDVERGWGEGMDMDMDIDMDMDMDIDMDMDMDMDIDMDGIHIQAPHPSSDTNTGNLATLLFHSHPKIISLLISTRHRNATLIPTSCINPTPHSKHTLSDPTHSPSESFHVAAKIMKGKGVFLQMHVKGVERCEEDVFVSGGLRGGCGRTSGVARVVEAVRRAGRWSVADPTTSECVLTATKNVFGRVVNGLEECDGGEKRKVGTCGSFVHVEQSMEVALDESFWRRVIDLVELS